MTSFMAVREKGTWKLEVAPLSRGEHSDLDASFTPDGRGIFFMSNRPASAQGTIPDYNIWRTARTATGRSAPTMLPEPGNGNRRHLSRADRGPAVV